MYISKRACPILDITVKINYQITGRFTVFHHVAISVHSVCAGYTQFNTFPSLFTLVGKLIVHA